MKAMYVEATPCVDYAMAIVGGYKTIETRSRNTLKSLVGERVAVIRTSRRGGKSKVVGYVTVALAYDVDNYAHFDIHRDHTLIPVGSKYDMEVGGKKWFYLLENPEKCKPYTPQYCGNHGRSWAIIEQHTLDKFGIIKGKS